MKTLILLIRPRLATQCNHEIWVDRPPVNRVCQHSECTFNNVSHRTTLDGKVQVDFIDIYPIFLWVTVTWPKGDRAVVIALCIAMYVTNTGCISMFLLDHVARVRSVREHATHVPSSDIGYFQLPQCVYFYLRVSSFTIFIIFWMTLVCKIIDNSISKIKNEIDFKSKWNFVSWWNIF